MLQQRLEEFFGFTSFRPGQREVVEGALEGRDQLVVMPTGSGKSLCYQLPACIAPGITLVISPLIALMKDQVDALHRAGVPATFINSSLSSDEQRQRLREIRDGVYKLVYVAPERFRSPRFREAIGEVEVSLFVVDEAHCVSQWGHDFRPDYLTLQDAREAVRARTTMALTATATPFVQRDIVEGLGIPDAEAHVTGFARDNLYYEVAETRSKGDKLARMVALLRHADDGSSIIYCATRKQVEEVWEELRGAQFEVGLYHAGLSERERDEVQDGFMHDEIPILVATNAFGMGVDKANVRSIVHYNVPGSLEAYYQEAGRAGRDGEVSNCLLLFNHADRGIHEFFNAGSFPAESTIQRVWKHLRHLGDGTHMTGSDRIAGTLNRARRGERVHAWSVESALRLLARGGHIDFGVRDGFPWIAVLDQARERDLRIDWEELARRRQNGLDQLTDVVRYATTRACRQ